MRGNIYKIMGLLSAAFFSAAAAIGETFSVKSPDGKLPEIVEIPNHPWFIGVQFHPELKSKPFAPAPLFVSFVKAAIDKSRLI